jgi:hypothetical protein
MSPKFFFAAFVIAMPIAGPAQEVPRPQTVPKPASKPFALVQPEWKVTVRVIDNAGNPVPNATVGIGYSTNGEPTGIHLLTDTNGLCVASAKGSVIGGYRVEKAGYYFTWFPGTRFATYTNDQWQPWNPMVEIPLKRIVKPIPMYAKRVVQGLPALDESIGFDLTAGDWVTPRGKGQRADIIFKKAYSETSSSVYYSKIEVSFPNPGDGIQSFQVNHPINQGSALRSPYEAPEKGYLPQLSREISAGHGPSKFEYDENRNYFFRVRTVLDEKGNVTSALYGKIYGDFMRFVYYLNPTPNDRNIEFDPKQNLMKDLQPLEAADAP